MREQPGHAAFIKRTANLAFDTRAVNFQQQRQQTLHGHQGQQEATITARDTKKSGLRMFRFHPGNSEGGHGADISAGQQDAGAGTKQAVVFQPGHRDGEPAEQKQEQRENRKEREGDRAIGLFQGHGGFAGRVPKTVRARGFEQQQQDRETGHEIFFELHAGAARGETAGVFDLEKRSAAAGGQFVHFEFFQALIFLEPHLEPAHERHQHAEAQEDRRGLAAQRLGKDSYAESGEEDHQRQREVHQSVLLYASVHFQLNSRSSNNATATARAAPA